MDIKSGLSAFNPLFCFQTHEHGQLALHLDNLQAGLPVLQELQFTLFICLPSSQA